MDTNKKPLKPLKRKTKKRGKHYPYKFANLKKGKVISIVGRKDGFAYKNSNIKIFIDVEEKKLVTPLAETFQALIWHLLVSHPDLQKNKTKW